MERFCSRCGSLVEGNGEFCPTCGERLSSAVNLEKPAAENNNANFYPNQNAASGMGTQNSNYSAMPNYPQVYNTVNSNPAGSMSVGQWVLTIFLSSLGFIGLILLIVWGFGSDVNSPRRNYARAMLIIDVIAIGIAILLSILFILAGINFDEYLF